VTKDVNGQKQKLIRAQVVSDRMDKSCVAKLTRLVNHPRGSNYMKRSTKFMFHDELNQAKCGDEVLIRNIKPKSGGKAFELVEIVTVNK